MEKDLELLKKKKTYLALTISSVVISFILCITFYTLFFTCDYDSPMYITFMILALVFLFITIFLIIPLVMVCAINGIETNYNGNHVLAVNGKKGFALYINKELIDIDKSSLIFTNHTIKGSLPSGEEVEATLFNSSKIKLRIAGKVVE